MSIYGHVAIIVSGYLLLLGSRVLSLRGQGWSSQSENTNLRKKAITGSIIAHVFEFWIARCHVGAEVQQDRKRVDTDPDRKFRNEGARLDTNRTGFRQNQQNARYGIRTGLRED